MLELDLTAYHDTLKISEKKGKRYIYDPIRKTTFLLQPEEFVRQLWIAFLHLEKEISYATLGVEKTITKNGVNRRYDLVYFKKGTPHILFEFKSYDQPINSKTALQAADYNQNLQVPYIVLSNGPQSYAFQIDFSTEKVQEIEEFPLL